MISPSPTKDEGIGNGAAFSTSVPNTPIPSQKKMLQKCTGSAVACLNRAKRVLSRQEKFNRSDAYELSL